MTIFIQFHSEMLKVQKNTQGEIKQNKNNSVNYLIVTIALLQKTI